MAPTRSPSPSLVQPLKKLKTSHVTTDVTTSFASGLFDKERVESLSEEYKTNGPFHYALVNRLFQDELLKDAKDECLNELSFTEKETDIYKVNQTGDLASLNYLSASQISHLPNLLALRNALYSPEFRKFLQDVTGCGPLSGTKQDMSVNSYTKGCHLLNHDDVIGTRRVSYILYMPLPHVQMWQKEWGGALELYPVKDGPNGVSEPESIPVKSIPPSWNQFIFFEVQPGKSFHSVEEVIVGGKGEDGRERLSISGWFHTAQPGEEGYVPEPVSEAKSSREQLVTSTTVFHPYPTSPDLSDPSMDLSLSDEDVSFLSEYLNPVYLQPRTMKTLSSRFVEESSLELHSFLSNALAEALEPRLMALDSQDGLGPERAVRIPPHTSGVQLPQSPDTDDSPKSWTLKGPPHKWRYCILAPRDPSAPITSVTPLSAHPSPSEILRVLQDELFPSQPFRTWINIVTRLLPLRYSVEARRFRPGLDYTLATSEDKEARLDAVLGLTPNSAQDGKSKGPPNEWITGDCGGWECYMAPHGEEDDPAVYRTSSRKSVPHTNGTANGNGHSRAQEAGPSKGHTNGHAAPPWGMDDEDEDDEEEEDEEDDSTLLTVQPGFNRLLLVLRDEKVMRFVKYVSAAAPGSRWDICGEYEVGVIQVDDQEDDP